MIRCTNALSTGGFVVLSSDRVRLLASSLVIALCAMMLTGCYYGGYRADVARPGAMHGSKTSEFRTRTALPALALVTPQSEPNCEFPKTDSESDERQKLDYERQCYRQAEIIARTRLWVLQTSVAKTISAIKRGDWCGVQSAGFGMSPD